jgi:hypothetical protein
MKIQRNCGSSRWMMCAQFFLLVLQHPTSMAHENDEPTKSMYQVEFRKGKAFLECSAHCLDEFASGDFVQVESRFGFETGMVCDVRPHDSEIISQEYSGESRQIVGYASEVEKRHLLSLIHDEERALSICIELASRRNLAIRVVGAEYSGDRKKLTYLYLGGKRVDFRELLRDLLFILRTKIWMQKVDLEGNYIHCSVPSNHPNSMALSVRKLANSTNFDLPDRSFLSPYPPPSRPSSFDAYDTPSSSSFSHSHIHPPRGPSFLHDYDSMYDSSTPPLTFTPRGMAPSYPPRGRDPPPPRARQMIPPEEYGPPTQATDHLHRSYSRYGPHGIGGSPSGPSNLPYPRPVVSRPHSLLNEGAADQFEPHYTDNIDEGFSGNQFAPDQASSAYYGGTIW